MNLNNSINSIPTPLIPQQQVVIPPITIPQGFQVQQKVQYKQLTSKGKEAAKQMDVGADARVAIFDEDADNLFYYKETDANGNVTAFETYSYSKVEEPPPPRYLTVDEFKEAMAEFAKTIKEDLSDGQFIRAKSNKQSDNGKSQHSNSGSSDSK